MGTARQPKTDRQVQDEHIAQSPVVRAISNVADALGLVSNTATFGATGGAVDLAKGEDWGSAAHRARVRLNSGTLPISPSAAAETVGGFIGGKGALTAGKALVSKIGSGVAALPRATAARAAIPTAAALGLGAFAASGSDAPPAPATPKPVENPVKDALGAGRGAETFITPQDQLSAYISSVLGGGATIREAQALGALVPATIKQGQTSKDATLGQTAELSQQIFANEIAQAQELAKTDPTAAQQATSKAMAGYFSRNAGLVGLNPANLAQAQLLAPEDQ